MTVVFFSFEALQEFDITCFLSIAMVEERILVVPWVWVDGLLAPTNTLIIFPLYIAPKDITKGLVPMN